MSRPPAIAASMLLQARAAAAAPAWFWPLVGTLIGGAALAIQLVDLRTAYGPARALRRPPAASQAVQEAP